jgi:RimJ/RimL family protein N-acetyltransferase
MTLKLDTAVKPVVELHSFSDVPFDRIAPTYLSWLNDLEVVTPIGSPELLAPKDINFIKSSFARFTAPNCLGFFIWLPEAKKYVGTAKLDKLNNANSSAEIGIMIGDKSEWGKGIASVVYKILIAHCFNELQLHRIWGGTDANNHAMRKTFLKLGFKEEGKLRESNCINGVWSDTHLYGLLKKEY